MAAPWCPGSWAAGPRGPWGCSWKPCPARTWIISCSRPAYTETRRPFRGLGKLAQLLAFFHSRPVPADPVSPEPALAYLDKVVAQLLESGLLTGEDRLALKPRAAWEPRLQNFPDRQVLIHGDATPTNFLFPDGRAVALDLERLRDRRPPMGPVLGGRGTQARLGLAHLGFSGSEGAIRQFFRMYLTATGP